MVKAVSRSLLSLLQGFSPAHTYKELWSSHIYYAHFKLFFFFLQDFNPFIFAFPSQPAEEIQWNQVLQSTPALCRACPRATGKIFRTFSGEKNERTGRWNGLKAMLTCSHHHHTSFQILNKTKTSQFITLPLPFLQNERKAHSSGCAWQWR